MSEPAVETEPTALERLLQYQVIHPQLVRDELEARSRARVPLLPTWVDLAAWEDYASRLRQEILNRIVFQGEAAAWRKAERRVEWLDCLEGGPGYHIRTLRYQAAPGLWIPALLYEPESLSGKVPVVLNVNGHEPLGKAVPYKQIRCINLAKRGMLALNLEWLGMGQLAIPNLVHVRMNQLDLCGTSGLAVFFLAMQRGLDLLLSLEHADPERVAVAGLSGGGWQTIVLSSLDPRVRLANPVAGYTSLRIGARFDDLGDSEQAPCDLATLADYAHLTALLAPRPTLLTYCAKDNCCFQACHTLPPLLDAARPIFRLYDQPGNLRSHVNLDPGTHNFDQDNREAFYRMLGDHFYAGDLSFDPTEIPCEDEVKSPEDLHVPLPEDNADFNTLALALSRDLPLAAELPTDPAAALAWQQDRRQQLSEIVRAKPYQVDAVHAGVRRADDLQATYWWLRMDREWTVPGVELVCGEPRDTALLVADRGKESAAAAAKWMLAAGYRVVALDPFHIGESKKIAGDDRDYLFALHMAALGDRPLGLQASQLAAVARWLQEERQVGPVVVVALGPLASLFALIAAGLEPAIAGLELHGSLGSLREVIEQNLSAEEAPDFFCFGLLQAFDIRQLAALVAPRPLKFQQPSDRVRQELAGLAAWYASLGVEFQPIE